MYAFLINYLSPLWDNMSLNTNQSADDYVMKSLEANFENCLSLYFSTLSKMDYIYGFKKKKVEVKSFFLYVQNDYSRGVLYII